VRVIDERPAYWRVVFDYPRFNIVAPAYSNSTGSALANERQPEPAGRSILKREPRILPSHLILTGRLELITAVGASGLPDPDG